jgi:hypothetical protein
MDKKYFTYIFIWICILTFIFFITKSINPNFFLSDAFMPPIKTEREIELETRMKRQGLRQSEMNEYRALSEQRNEAWDNQPMVSQILKDVDSGKEAKLKVELAGRNLSEKEIEEFMQVLHSEFPHLLKE